MLPIQFAACGERYHTALDTWEEITGEESKTKELLQRELPWAINELADGSRDVFNVLSVGSGDGGKDLEVLRIVQQELQKHEKCREMRIFNRAIDPNPHHIDIYRNAIERLPEMLRGKTVFDLRAETFGEYMHAEESRKEDDLAMKFDIVHFVHSIYYLDIEASLKHCFEKELKENGKVVIIAGGSVISADYTRDSTTRNASNATVKPEFNWKTVDVTIEVAKKYGWKFKRYSQEYDIDLSEVFVEDSIKGNLLLDFIVHTNHLRDSGDQAKIKEVLDTLQNQTRVLDGKHIAKKVDNILIISK